MSEEILSALMKMFAIITRKNGSNNGRQFVESFLTKRLNSKFVKKYLRIYDDCAHTFHQSNPRKDGKAKRDSLNAVRILKICQQINRELSQVQKVIVTLQLIEYIYANSEINKKELDFVETVSDTFNIPKEEFHQNVNFIQPGEISNLNPSTTLIIDNKPIIGDSEFKHFYSKGLKGVVKIQWIKSVNQCVLTYLGTGELYLNGQNIIQEKLYILNPGSSIRNSSIKPIYYSDILSVFMNNGTDSTFSFQVKNLECKFKNGKNSLHQINLKEQSGKLIGILGGSGAGKSTLLNALNGSKKPDAGNVTINGIDIYEEKEKTEGLIGMVAQEDLLIEELTVYQNLYYNAKLCFGSKNETEIKIQVEKVLIDLGIQNCRDLKIGNPIEKIISGGQRKRLNIALELIREPPVLFVDEPTSGLSSADSENIIDLLKELTLKGKLVFVVIHQPSSTVYKMFDNILIIDEGGYPIYYGNPLDAIIYFKSLTNQINKEQSECNECGNVNPEQLFNIIECKVLDEFGNSTSTRKTTAGEWNKYYEQHLEQKNNLPDQRKEIPENIFKIPNRFKQWKVFFKRDLLSKISNKQYIVITLLEAPFLAIILASFLKFSKANENSLYPYTFGSNVNIPAFLFIATIVALFIGLIISAEEIIRDKKNLKREAFLNLSKGSYLMSKIAILFIISAIQTFLFVLLGNSILEIEGMNLGYWLVLFSTSCYGNLLGLNISASFNSIITIYIIIPFLIIPQLLLSGVIVKYENLNPAISSQKYVPLIGETMVSKWAMEALAVEQFKNNSFNKQFYAYDKKMSNASFKKNYWINALSNTLEAAKLNYSNSINKKKLEKDLMLLKNEIASELNLKKHTIFPKALINNLSTSTFNLTVANEINKILINLKADFRKDYNYNDRLKEGKINTLTKDEKQKAIFIQEKQRFFNENLSNLLVNQNSFMKILKEGDAYLQKSDPIYRDPKGSFWGRAHLYAPRKQLFNRYYDTTSFNIVVIWLMTFILTISLYFNILGKLIILVQKGVEKCISSSRAY